jgi:FdhD protein
MRIYLQVRSSRVTEVQGTVVAELPLSIHVNGERVVTLLCSPFQVDSLVVGHLWMERVINGIDDIVRLDVSEVDGRADVELTGPLPAPSPHPPRPAALHSALRLTPAVVSARIAELAEASVHYKESRGIHSAALCDKHGLLKGRALLEGISTEDRLLVSSGRISSELLLRAARMVCRSSPRGPRPPTWPLPWPRL